MSKVSSKHQKVNDFVDNAIIPFFPHTKDKKYFIRDIFYKNNCRTVVRSSKQKCFHSSLVIISDYGELELNHFNIFNYSELVKYFDIKSKIDDLLTTLYSNENKQ